MEKRIRTFPEVDHRIKRSMDRIKEVGSNRDIILAIGIRNGYFSSLCYAERYAPDMVGAVEEAYADVLSQIERGRIGKIRFDY